MADGVIGNQKMVDSQNVVAKVMATQGDVSARSEQQSKSLKAGENLSLNDTIHTAGSSVLVIKFANGAVVTLGHDQELTLDEKFLKLLEDIEQKDSIGEAINFDRIEQALEDGQTIDEVLPAPAAGESGFTPGAGGESGAPGVRIEYNADSTTPTSGFETSTFGGDDNFRPEQPGAQVISLDPITVSLVGPSSVAEGDVTANYTVSLDGSVPAGSSFIVSFNYSGVAANGTDFNGIASVEIPAGNQSISFVINTLDDILVEGVESFVVSIADVSDSSGNFTDLFIDGSANSVVTDITDVSDLNALTFSLSGDSSVVEGDIANYQITIGGSEILAGESVTIQLNTADGVSINPALEGVDFNSADGTLTINGPLSAGDSISFVVATLDDALAEGLEDFSVAIATPSQGVVLGAGSVTTSITDQTGSDNPPGAEDTALISLVGPT
ncbi:MAG: retention module-containing protein, partial [Cellvibrionaceae bacterium]